MPTKFRRDRFDPFAEPTDEEVRAGQELDLIDQAVQRRMTTLRREQATWPYDQQRSESEMHDLALREVQDAVKKAERAERNRRIQADVSSALRRNQHLLGSWMAGGAYAASGELGAVLGGLTPLSTLGGVGVAAAGAAATTSVLWKRIKTLPSRHWQRLRTGVLAGCATCVALPVSPLELPWHASVLAAGTGALIGASARYWRENAPAYPPMGGYPSVEQTATVEATTAEAEPVDEEGELDEAVAAVIADWNSFVRDGQILSGAELKFHRVFEYGWIFTVRLVRGKQRVEHLRQKLPDIAAALDVGVDELSVDPDPRSQLTPKLTIRTSTPDTTYTGPVVERPGDGTVRLELGPYRDGLGVVSHTLLTGQLTDKELAAGEPPEGSAVGGYVLGDKGSGKSRLMESIALGAIEAGIEVWYLDPQGGASSPVLRDNAAWALSGLDSADGRAFGNVEDLLEALEGVVAVRQDENSLSGATGFQHSRQRPMIMVIIDECHQVFEHYGHRFGEIDRIARKLGVAFFGGSQSPKQDVFGGSLPLRNGMAGGNAYLLKYNGSNGRLAFGALDDAVARGAQQLPINRGHGFALNSDRPLSVFQTRYTRDLRPFFAELTPVVLDEMARIGAGDPYARRHHSAEANHEAVRRRMEGYRNGTIKPGRRAKKDQQSHAPSAPSSGGSAVSYLFPGTQPLRPHNDAEGSAPKLTDRQNKILEMLADTAMSAKEIAVDYGNVTNRTISNDLRILREYKLVRLADEAEGRYAAARKV